jgi:hypothetical protein
MPELNPKLVAWNKTNQERRKKLSAEFQHNLKREDVPIIADQRQRRHFRLELSTYETFRRAPSYECEVRSIVEDLAHLPLYQAQKARAELKRLKVGETEGRPWLEVFAEFIRKPEVRDARPSEMWPLLISHLDELKCKPREIVDQQNPRKTKIKFEVEMSGGKLGKHSLTYGRFQNLVSHFRARKASSC